MKRLRKWGILNFKMQLLKNKRGQVESIILVVVTIFIIGIIVFFMNHVNENFIVALDVSFEANPTLNNTEAHISTTRYSCD